MADKDFTGLILPTPEVAALAAAGVMPCADFTVDDIDDYKHLMIPENDPQNFLRMELQKRNDCQGNSLTTCTEIIEKRTRKRSAELARTFAYQMSEVYDRRGVGNDVGSSIQSGVLVATEVGLPTEQEYSYDPYVRGEQAFKARCTSSVLASAKTRRAARYVPAPPWRTMLAHTLLGHPLHWGTFWPLKLNSNNTATKYVGAHGTGGHAYAGVWPVLATTGQWLLKMANSHGTNFGREGYFFITEEFYEEARQIQNSPFGAYLIYGNDDPLKAYYHPEDFDLM